MQAGEQKNRHIAYSDIEKAMREGLVEEERKETHPTLAASGFRVDLSNEDGAGYTGTIYLGSEEAPVKVLFDTGSDFLAVTSSLCNDPKLGQ